MKATILSLIAAAAMTAAGCRSSRQSESVSSLRQSGDMMSVESVTRAIFDSCRLDITLTIDTPVIRIGPATDPTAVISARSAVVTTEVFHRRSDTCRANDSTTVISRVDTSDSRSASTSVDSTTPFRRTLVAAAIAIAAIITLGYRVKSRLRSPRS